MKPVNRARVHALDHAPLSLLLARAPLVGRSAQLELLRGELAQVVTGEGRNVVLLVGVPGVGKTRLAEEVGHTARAAGAFFFQGRYLRDGTPAYGPWVDALRAGARQLTVEELVAVAPYRDDLTPVLPDLAALLTSPLVPRPSSLGSEERRRRLYDGMAELVLAIARRGPLVLLLDDLQWAPDLGLLAHVARRVCEAPVLLVAAAREQELRDQPGLLREWNDLQRTRLGIQMAVDPLTDGETTELIAHYLGTGPADQLADVIYRQTGGNPFFVEEVLRALAELGIVRPTETGWEVAGERREIIARQIIPDSIRFIIEDRVTRLGSDAPTILAQAAVLGQEFDAATLQAMSGTDEDAVVAVLERAVAARLLRDVSTSSAERYAFWDDQIQEVLYGALPAPRRYRYHRRAGEAIEALSAGRLEIPAEDLARHFRACRSPSKAAHYAFLAAEKLERLHDWTRAAALYGQAAEALAGLLDDPDTRHRRAEALYRQVRVSFFAERPADNLERLRMAYDLVPEPAAQRAGEQRRAEADRHFLAWLDYWIGRLLIYELAYREALAHFRRVEGSSKREGNSKLHALAVSSIGRTLVEMGDFAAAVPPLTRAALSLAGEGNWSEWIWNAAFLGIAHAAGGESDIGVAEAEGALARAVEIGERNLVGPCNLFLGFVHLFSGAPEAAIESGRAALAVGDATGNRFPSHLACGLIAWAESRLGRHELARDWMDRYRASGRDLGDRLVFGDWFAAASAELALNAGHKEEARRLADEAGLLAEAAGSPFTIALVHRVREAACTPASRRRGPVELFEHGDRRGKGQEAVFPDGLSIREVEVLRRIAEGSTTKEMAAELSVSIATVERHITNLYTKIGARGRADATAYALRQGIAAPDRPSM